MITIQDEQIIRLPDRQANAVAQFLAAAFHEEPNLSFYERQRFEVEEKGHIPQGGPTNWTMIRRPTE